jgi:hypothetical protein
MLFDSLILTNSQPLKNTPPHTYFENSASFINGECHSLLKSKERNKNRED